MRGTGWGPEGKQKKRWIFILLTASQSHLGFASGCACLCLCAVYARDPCLNLDTHCSHNDHKSRVVMAPSFPTCLPRLPCWLLGHALLPKPWLKVLSY